MKRFPARLGTREQWEKRLAQWREFNEWERRQPPEKSTPEERIARAGEMLEFATQFRRGEPDQGAGIADLARNVARMKEALSLLGTPDHQA